MKKLPSIWSLYQSAARSESTSKMQAVWGPAPRSTAWTPAMNDSNPAPGSSSTTRVTSPGAHSGAWRAKRK